MIILKRFPMNLTLCKQLYWRTVIRLLSNTVNILAFQHKNENDFSTLVGHLQANVKFNSSTNIYAILWGTNEAAMEE